MAPATRLRIVYPRDLVFSALTGHSDKKAEGDCHGLYSAWARNAWIDAHATRTGRIIFKRPFPGHSVAALPAAIRQANALPSQIRVSVFPAWPVAFASKPFSRADNRCKVPFNAPSPSRGSSIDCPSYVSRYLTLGGFGANT